MLTPRLALNLWMIGFLQAGFVLVAFPKRFARDTAWGPSPWQREIAIWNIGTLTGLVRLGRPGADPHRSLTEGFTVLSTLFAANHLATGVRHPRKFGHWLAAGLNLLGIAAGAVALSSEQE